MGENLCQGLITRIYKEFTKVNPKELIIQLETSKFVELKKTNSRITKKPIN
jgi:hypothetical protein